VLRVEVVIGLAVQVALAFLLAVIARLVVAPASVEFEWKADLEEISEQLVAPASVEPE